MILDIIIVAVIIVFALVYRKRGFVNIVTGMLSTVVSFVVALILKEPITKFIQNTKMYENLIKNIVEFIMPENMADGSAPIGMLGKLFSGSMQSQFAANSVPEMLAEGVVGIGILIIVFLASSVLTKLLSKLLNGLSKIPGINMINKVIGTVWGVALGLLAVYAVFAIGAGSFLANNEFFVQQMETSVLAKTLCQNNLLLNLFMK